MINVTCKSYLDILVLRRMALYIHQEGRRNDLYYSLLVFFRFRMIWWWGGALTGMKYSHCLENISVISHWLCVCVCEAGKNSSSRDSHLDRSNSQSGPCQPGNMDQMWLIETIWGLANVLHQVPVMASCVGISRLPIIISVAIKCQVSGYLRMYLGRQQHDTGLLWPAILTKTS